MGIDPQNEDWILDIGGAVIGKKAAGQLLSPYEHLIHCLWVTYICMTNAGDLDQAHILYHDWRLDAISQSHDLMLPFTKESFSLPQDVFQREYFGRFDHICAEIRKNDAPNKI